MPSSSGSGQAERARRRPAHDGRAAPGGGGHQPVRRRRARRAAHPHRADRTVPTLIAHSAVRYAEWCQVVARFAARRLGGDSRRPGPPDGGPGRPRCGHGRLQPVGPSSRPRRPGRGRGPGLPPAGHRLRRVRGSAADGDSRLARRRSRTAARCWSARRMTRSPHPRSGVKRGGAPHEDPCCSLFRAPRALEGRRGRCRAPGSARGPGPDGLRRDVPLGRAPAHGRHERRRPRSSRCSASTRCSP